MEKKIVVAGSTGALGKKLVRQIKKRGGIANAIVRSSSERSDIDHLERLGAKIVEIDTSNEHEIAEACEGAHCVVSCLAGLQSVIVDAQTKLLNGAVKAGVSRFIPSDFAIDFYKLPEGRNRNLDLRREFALQHLEHAPIKATSILNGLFSEYIFTPTPLISFKLNRCIYFGDENRLFDITAMDDTADYTAAAAMDDETPRFLRIAGNICTINDLVKHAEKGLGQKYSSQYAGPLALLPPMIATAKFFDNGEDLYPTFQGLQYYENLLSGEAKFASIDNDRYLDVSWTPLHETLAKGQPDFIQQEAA